MAPFKLFNCFGKPKCRDNSLVLKLKAQRDELDNYKEVLEDRLSEFNDLCLKYVKENNKQKALFVLKRKALVSKQLSIIEGYSLKILEIISDTETAFVEADVLKNLQIGRKLLIEVTKELNRRDLESFCDSDRDNINQIAESLGIVSRNFEVDDLELVQELDLLTSDLNSINYESYSQSTPKDQHLYDLDLTRLKSLSQNTSTVQSSNTTKRNLAT